MNRERGAASAGLAVTVTFVVLVALVLTEMGSLVAMRHRAAAAADLAALAASRAAEQGDDGCAAGRAAARANHAELVACRMDVSAATVRARATSARWWGHRWAAEVKARAAPDYYVDASRRRQPTAWPNLTPVWPAAGPHDRGSSVLDTT